MTVAYVDSAYFLGRISDNYTERKSAEKLKPRLRSFRVVVPQVVLGEVLTIVIRDHGHDPNVFRKKLDILANELMALIEPKECLPVLESKHIHHMEYFMNHCRINATDASILSFVVDDAESEYLVTDDEDFIQSQCVYEYEEHLREEGRRKRMLRITDHP